MVLEKSSGIDDFGGMVWQLVVALAVAWLLTFLLISKGIEGTGYVVYVTTVFPYVVLMIIGVQGNNYIRLGLIFLSSI